MKVATLLDLIDQGSLALPEFQRGYVWNRDQVRGLMLSLYRRRPVGSLLVWVTKSESARARGDGFSPPGMISLLLDGQQRLTSLYGIMRGKPPRFFDGNASTFTGLHFHLGDEAFEFYAPVKMKDSPWWIDVTSVLQPDGLGPALQRVLTDSRLASKSALYIARLNAINNIKDIELHVEQVTGEEKTVDVVVDIFNQVNSGGTKLSKGDLALAKACADWPEARQEMKQCLAKWRKSGFNFKLELLLRCITTITTGQAMFSGLSDVQTAQVQQGLREAERAVDQCLNLIASRLGLDHDRVFGSRYSLPLLARYQTMNGGRLPTGKERDRLLYWYVHTFLWGRYAGSTESVLNQDLEAIKSNGSPIERLIENLRRHRGDLRIQPEDFRGWSRGARFYPLLYMLTRVWRAKDFESELELSQHLLGQSSCLELHHVFPRAQLYKAGYKKSEVNALANFTFLTKETNQLLSDELPEKYLARSADRSTGLVESHWIPMDRDLWKVGNYRPFLEERRRLLAKAANDFLDQLSGGTVPETVQPAIPILERRIETEIEEERLLREINEWVMSKGLGEGEFGIEVLKPETEEIAAVIDLGWPNGLQEGLSQPVALLLNEDEETEEAVIHTGYRFFRTIEAFRRYVDREVAASEATAVK